MLGDGGTTWGTGTLQEGMHRYHLDRGDTQISEEELRKTHLPPYLEAIKAGVKTVMISFNSWNVSGCRRCTNVRRDGWYSCNKG